MTKSNRGITLAMALGILCIGLSACQKVDPAADKGPAEKIGQQLDQAAAKAAVELNKVAEQAGKGLEKAGEKIQNAAKEAKNNTAPADAQK
jgi:hypothetical protein